MGTIERLKEVLRRDLNVGRQEDIPDDVELMGGRFEFDSLDTLRLIGSIEKEFGVKVPKKIVQEEAFKNLQTLAGFVEELQQVGSPERIPGGHEGG